MAKCTCDRNLLQTAAASELDRQETRGLAQKMVPSPAPRAAPVSADIISAGEAIFRHFLIQGPARQTQLVHNGHDAPLMAAHGVIYQHTLKCFYVFL